MGNDYTTYQKLMLGEPVHFDEARPPQERTIPAYWVKEAVARGRKIEISHAIIQGDLDLEYAHLKTELSIGDSTLAGSLNLSFATVEQILRLARTAIAGEARFLGLKVEGQANFEGAKFEKKAAFDRADVAQDAFFRSTTFVDEARFLGLKVGGQASFDGAKFEKEAAFDGAEVAQAAFFRSTTFVGEAGFIGLKVGGQANFEGAKFEKKAAFDGAEVAQDAFFSSTTFVGEARFHGLKVGGQADFEGAKFEKKAAFDRAEVAQAAFFRSTTFVGEARFHGLKFGGQADFRGAKFENQAFFQEAAIHGYFFLCALDRGPGWEMTSFKWVSFRDASCGTVILQEGLASAPEVKEGLYAVGWTYRHVSGQEELLKLLDNEMAEYDRQPYVQLEKVARDRGDDAFANEVYYQRRKQEYRKTIRPFSEKSDLAPVPKFLSWLGRVVWDRLLFMFVGYGVKPLRLIAWIIGIVALETLVFEKAGTVALKGASGAPDLTPWESFWFSLNLFVPGVQLFVPGEWKPADGYVILANFFRLFGWLIAGIGIAYLTGIARRLSRA